MNRQREDVILGIVKEAFSLSGLVSAGKNLITRGKDLIRGTKTIGGQVFKKTPDGLRLGSKTFKKTEGGLKKIRQDPGGNWLHQDFAHGNSARPPVPLATGSRAHRVANANRVSGRVGSNRPPPRAAPKASAVGPQINGGFGPPAANRVAPAAAAAPKAAPAAAPAAAAAPASSAGTPAGPDPIYGYAALGRSASSAAALVSSLRLASAQSNLGKVKDFVSKHRTPIGAGLAGAAVGGVTGAAVS